MAPASRVSRAPVKYVVSGGVAGGLRRRGASRGLPWASYRLGRDPLEREESKITAHTSILKLYRRHTKGGKKKEDR